MSAAPESRYAVIVGLGATGLSAARYLRARGWRLASDLAFSALCSCFVLTHCGWWVNLNVAAADRA